MNWPPTLEDLRVRIGLEPDDDSMDDQLLAAQAVSQSAVETYLDRWLEYKTYIEEFVGGEPGLLFKAWPVKNIISISLDEGQDIPTASVDWKSYHLDKTRGILHMRTGYRTIVEYVGGLEPIPDDLIWAMLTVFDGYWGTTYGWGSTSSGGVVTGSGEVKKVSLVGIGSVDFDVGTSSGSSSSGGARGVPWSLIPAAAIDILDRYRNHAPIGAG